MADSDDKLSYLYCLELWFEKYSNYDELKTYIVGNDDKAAVGTNIILAFEKFLNEAQTNNQGFRKKYSEVALQFLNVYKQKPEQFVNELFVEMNKLQQSNDRQSNSRCYQLENIERDLKNSLQNGGHQKCSAELLHQIVKTIDDGVKYFIKRVEERALVCDLRRLAKTLYKSLGHLRKLLVEDHNRLHEIFIELFQHCVYMELTPPRIIKKQTSKSAGTCFKVSFSLLLDEEFLKISQPIKINCFYVNQNFVKQFDPKKQQTFELALINGEKFFAGDSCSFDKLKVHTGNKRSRVTDEQGLLIFRTQLTPKILNLHEPIPIAVRSQPVVLIAHTNQLAEAEGTLLWGDYFRTEGGADEFATRQHIEMGEMLSALDQFFQTRTGHGLTPDNKIFLEEKLRIVTDNRDQVTSQNMFRDRLPDRTFTFWDWIFAAYRLIKDHLLVLWKEGIVHGFISYEQGLKLCQSARAPPGTWLLRLSESVLGGISINVVIATQELIKWDPFTTKDLSAASCSKLILQYPDLKYFINGKTKEELLGSVEDCCDVHAGYQPRGMRCILPAIPRSVSNLATPSHDGTLDDLNGEMEFFSVDDPNLPLDIDLDENYP